MRELLYDWYVLLGALNAAVAFPLRALGDGLGVPAVSALLFGLIGATSPCQLTTNAGALAYVARDSVTRSAVARRAAAFVLGKVLVYTILGGALLLAGRQALPVEFVVAVRRLLGPLMVLLGVYLLGLLPLRFAVGQRLADWLEARAAGRSVATGAFLLGAAFSLAFCPTLFLLFFVLTLPLALTSPLGVLYPGLFALGTALPLLVLSGIATVALDRLRPVVRGAKQANRWLRPAAAVGLLLAGLNDTLLYWAL